jgi:hypothetical protein
MGAAKHDPSRPALFGCHGESCPRRAAPTRRLERMTATGAMLSTPSRQVGPRRTAADPADMASPDELWALIESDVTVK